MSTAFLKTLGSLILAALIIMMLIGALRDAKNATVDLANQAGHGYCANFNGLCDQ